MVQIDLLNPPAQFRVQVRADALGRGPGKRWPLAGEIDYIVTSNGLCVHHVRWLGWCHVEQVEVSAASDSSAVRGREPDPSERVALPFVL